MLQEEVIEDDDDDDCGGNLTLVEELYLLESVDNDDPDYKELKSTNGAPHYNAMEMVTGAKIERFMRLGDVITSRQSTQRRVKQMNGQVRDGPNKSRLSFVFRAIAMLKSEQFETFGIYDGKDQNVKEFEAARTFDIPSQFRQLPRGWARRRERGQMYGRKYIGRFKMTLYKWFKAGSDNPEMKQGPSMMAEKLRVLHPGIYTIPSFTEIQSYVTLLFTKQKKGRRECRSVRRVRGRRR